MDTLATQQPALALITCAMAVHTNEHVPDLLHTQTAQTAPHVPAFDLCQALCTSRWRTKRIMAGKPRAQARSLHGGHCVSDALPVPYLRSCGRGGRQHRSMRTRQGRISPSSSVRAGHGVPTWARPCATGPLPRNLVQTQLFQHWTNTPSLLRAPPSGPGTAAAAPAHPDCCAVNRHTKALVSAVRHAEALQEALGGKPGQTARQLAPSGRRAGQGGFQVSDPPFERWPRPHPTQALPHPHSSPDTPRSPTHLAEPPESTGHCPAQVQQACLDSAQRWSMMALVNSEHLALPPRSPVRYWPSAMVASTAACITGY